MTVLSRLVFLSLQNSLEHCVSNRSYKFVRDINASPSRQHRRAKSQIILCNVHLHDFYEVTKVVQSVKASLRPPEVRVRILKNHLYAILYDTQLACVLCPFRKKGRLGCLLFILILAQNSLL